MNHTQRRSQRLSIVEHIVLVKYYFYPVAQGPGGKIRDFLVVAQKGMGLPYQLRLAECVSN